MSVKFPRRRVALVSGQAGRRCRPSGVIRKAVALMLVAMIGLSSVIALAEAALHDPIESAFDHLDPSGTKKPPAHPGLPSHHDCTIGGCAHALAPTAGWSLVVGPARPVVMTLRAALSPPSASPDTPEHPPKR